LANGPVVDGKFFKILSRPNYAREIR